MDLRAAIDFVKNQLGSIDGIGLVGSSLGGFLSLIQASKDRTMKGVVVWATPLHMDDLRSKKQEKEYPLPPESFFEDLPNHRLLPLLPMVSNCLVIHGEKDELVPLEQPLTLFKHLNLPKEIHIIGGADHQLTHPAHRQRAIDLTVDWFKRLRA